MATFPQSALVAGTDSVAPQTSKVHELLLTWALPFGIALIYSAFRTKNYYWDGISFASSIESVTHLDSSLIHPHHLLYNVFGFVLYRAASFFRGDIRAVDVLQYSNCFLSPLCLALFFRFLRSTLRSSYISTLLTLAFAFSSTWWKYSTDADAYVPSIIFLLICTNLLFAASTLRPVHIALAHTCSMLFHQLAVLFFPVVIIAIALQRSLPVKSRVKLCLAYAVTASLLTIAINYYCFHLQTGAFDWFRFARWLTAYLHGPEAYSFSFDVPNAISFTIRGQVRLFFEGRLGWLRGNMSSPTFILLGVLAVLVVVITMRLIRKLIAFPSGLQRPALFAQIDKRLLYTCGVWILCYLAFLFFWYPYFEPYRLFYLPPLLWIVGSVITARLRNEEKPTTVALLVAGMALSNFLFFILPMTQPRNYPPLEFALHLKASWPPGSLVLFSRSDADNRLIRYFNPTSEWRPMDLGQLAELEAELNSRDPLRPVWLETSAIDHLSSSKVGADWLDSHTNANCSEALVNQKFRIRFLEVFPAESGVKRANCLN